MVIVLSKQCSESKTISKLNGANITEQISNDRLIDNESTDKAVLVVIDPRDQFEADANSEELRLLAESAGVQIVDEMHVHRDIPNGRHYLGKGQAEDLFLLVQSSEVDIIIFGEELSPKQQRNLEDITKARIVDRTQLILDIFAQRARTSEGKIQVELAQLQYLLPRLTGKGIAMSRVGGASSGGVATRGPGETKLETDRRRIRVHIEALKDELEEVVKHRTVQNKARQRLMVSGAALVGYTSAGKSTLLKLLSGADVYVDAKLFATLDPTTRKVDLPNGYSIMLSDTVGFLRNLPHKLISAFRATLEEVTDADFLIHVVDANHPFIDQQRESVMEVLSELGAQDKPIITVFNKSDLIKDQYELRKLVADTPYSCYMSSLTGEGVDNLINLIGKVVSEAMSLLEVLLPFDKGDLAALCHEHGKVMTQEYRPEGIYLVVQMPPDLAPKITPYVIDKNGMQE